MRIRSTHVAPLVLVILGLILGVLSARSVDQTADDELATRLRADASELAILIQGFAASFESDLTALGAIALVADDPVAGHANYLAANDVGSTHVLVDLSGKDPVLLSAASATNDPDDLAEATENVGAVIEDGPVRDQLDVLAETGGFAFLVVPGEDALVMAAVSHADERIYADVVYFEIGLTGQFLAAQVGDIDDFALYAGGEADRETVVFASTADLPLAGTTETATLAIGGQEVLVEVSGSANPALPPALVLAGWVLVMSIIAGILWVALRRRDAAVAARHDAELAEGRFRAVLDGSPDTVMLWHDDEMTVLNRSDVFGHAVGPLTERADFIELVHPDDRYLVEGIEVDEPDADGVDIRVVTADDTIAWARVRVRALLDGSDTNGSGAADVLAVVTETTAVHEAEEHRARMEAELQQAQRIESVGQLAGGIAHDFNNLLAAISSTAELISADVEDPRTQRDVEEIIDATRRGAALTRRLLTFSKRTAVTEGPVEVNSVVGELGTLLRRAVGEHIELSISLCEQNLVVKGDAGELEQVVTNLVINARDAASGPGHRIRVKTRHVGDRAVIEVIDNGTGMSEDVQERAFEPFFSTKSIDQGTGLGLSIVYGIVSRMGGTVKISSSEGTGATFTVEFELIEPAETTPNTSTPGAVAATAAGASLPATPRGGETVLLVEDEPAVRRAASRLLERAGHSVRSAADGHEAIESVLSGFAPTVLLTDVVLPGTLTGRDVADRVRELVPDVRVIYASGYSRDLINADQLESERALFVAKPFSSRALLSAVNDVPYVGAS